MNQPDKPMSRNSCYRSTQSGIKVNFWVDYYKRGGIWDRANDCVQRDFLNTLPVFNWLTKLIAPPLLKILPLVEPVLLCCADLVLRNVLIVPQCSHFLRTSTYCWDKRRYFSIKKLHTSPLKSSQYAKVTVAFLCVLIPCPNQRVCVGYRDLENYGEDAGVSLFERANNPNNVIPLLLLIERCSYD